MIVAPVAPTPLAESTTLSVKFGLTIATMHLYAITPLLSEIFLLMCRHGDPSLRSSSMAV
jgi:hypothetical protein